MLSTKFDLYQMFDLHVTLTWASQPWHLSPILMKLEDYERITQHRTRPSGQLIRHIVQSHSREAARRCAPMKRNHHVTNGSGLQPGRSTIFPYWHTRGALLMLVTDYTYETDITRDTGVRRSNTVVKVRQDGMFR